MPRNICDRGCFPPPEEGPAGLGRDAYHAQMTEMLFLLFLLAPIVAGAPYLLARWDAYKRADNARRRMERMAK